MTQIANIVLVPCPAARKASRKWYAAQNAQAIVLSYGTRFQ